MRHIRRRTLVLISLLLAMLMGVSGCSGYRVGGKALKEISEEEMQEPETLFENVMLMFSKGTLENLNELSYSSSVTFEEEWQEWETYKEEYGTFQEASVDTAYRYGDDMVICGTVTLEKGTICIDIKMNKKNQLAELYFYMPAETEEAAYTLPDTVTEVAVTVGEGTDYPLDAVITMPADAAESGQTYPAVVLVHGTGANDMDQSAGNTKMFRDLAWRLAEKGIIVIRYDKRTFAYSGVWNENATLETLTVDWEIVDDAVAATETLREQSMVDPERVYIVGHSLGGLVIPRIDAAGGDYAGYVLMAVPDRPWQEAAYDQYLNYGLADMDSDDIYYACSYLESQLKDINNKLDTYSEDSLVNENLLGMPAQYWKDLNTVDYVECIQTTEKPVLLLQGQEDYQIRADADYEGWQKKLEGRNNVTMKIYEGLNHLFMKSQGCFKGNSMEYMMPNHVSEDVISDISAFIGK